MTARYERRCRNKKQYKNRKEATDIAIYYYGTNKINQRPYECKACGLWHLTKIVCFLGLIIYAVKFFA